MARTAGSGRPRACQLTDGGTHVPVERWQTKVKGKAERNKELTADLMAKTVEAEWLQVKLTSCTAAMAARTRWRDDALDGPEHKP